MRSTEGIYYSRLDHVRAFAAYLVFMWHFLHMTPHFPVPYASNPVFPFALLDEGHTGVALVYDAVRLSLRQVGRRSRHRFRQLPVEPHGAAGATADRVHRRLVRDRLVCRRPAAAERHSRRRAVSDLAARHLVDFDRVALFCCFAAAAAFPQARAFRSLERGRVCDAAALRVVAQLRRGAAHRLFGPSSGASTSSSSVCSSRWCPSAAM